MYKRAEELFNIYWKYIGMDWQPNFKKIERPERVAWFRVACAEAEKVEEAERLYWDEYNRLKQDMATMVPRKHYTDAIKSLSMCQSQIETLMIELKRWNPTSVIAQDASTVLGLLEAMIDANPDMQTDDYRDKRKQDRDEAERIRREKFVARIWESSSSPRSFDERLKWNKENVFGTVDKDYKP